MTSLRLSASFSLSLGVTAALFWFLGVVTSAAPETGTWVPTIPVEVKHLVPDVTAKPPPIVKPPKAQPKPIGPAGRLDPKSVGPELVDPMPIDGGMFDPRGGIGPHDEITELPRVSGSDRGPLPSVRIEPDYPENAKLRGITGWVTFRFTVTRDGSVKDVEIVDAQPKRVWDAAALRAVSSWKYQPAIRDGRPVEQTGLMVTYHFEL